MRALAVVLLASLTFGCASAKLYTKRAAHDVVAVAHGPRLKSAAIAVAATGAALLVDDEVARIARNNQSRALDRIADAVEPLGGGDSDKVIAGVLLYGLAAKNATAKSIAFDAFVASLLASHAIVPVVKQLTDRTRPNGGDQSFPSNHAAEAFTLASVVAEHASRPWMKRAAYGIAGGVAFARVYHDAHWTSDVVAGAAIGTFVGHTVAKTNVAFAVSPVVVRGGGGILVTWHPRRASASAPSRAPSAESHRLARTPAAP
ncbi:MAG: phosphatase PAP2 family protein [Acidobacteria bacterium]|nr:phosphatase PAP2 family protein [Acidobacteriota bacterium]MBV9477956.1 phosphatase PAP2 family protein [Acidobacteriota bacterium]